MTYVPSTKELHEMEMHEMEMHEMESLDREEILREMGFTLEYTVTDQGTIQDPTHFQVTISYNNRSVTTPFTMGAGHRTWNKSAKRLLSNTAYHNWPEPGKRVRMIRPFKRPMDTEWVELFNRATVLPTPTLSDVLWNLTQDSNLVRYGQDFQEFCDEFGLDDPPSACEMWQGCQASWQKLAKLGVDIDFLDALFMGY